MELLCEECAEKFGYQSKDFFVSGYCQNCGIFIRKAIPVLDDETPDEDILKERASKKALKDWI